MGTSFAASVPMPFAATLPRALPRTAALTRHASLRGAWAPLRRLLPRAAATFTIVPALSDCRTRMFSNEGACGSKTWRPGPRPVRSLAPLRGTARDDALSRSGLRSLLRCRKPAETAAIEVGGSVVLVDSCGERLVEDL